MNKAIQHSVFRLSRLYKLTPIVNVRETVVKHALWPAPIAPCHMCMQRHAPFHTTAVYGKYNSKRKRPTKKVNRPPKSMLANAPVIPIKKSMTVQELADRINTSVDNVFEMMLYLDNYHTDNYDKPESMINDFDIIKALVNKFGYRHTLQAKEKPPRVDKDAYRQPPADPSNLVKRPPVVTIMGHVDHGKTTLLDALRKSNIVAKEFGGITQHIGAFSVTLKDGNRITFLDTPGHAAFSAMRARGAKATDIVVLVVAGDDGVMNQTVESIQHAMEADVPIIIAINKMDRPEADIERTKNGLLQHGIQLEGYGGDIQAVPISALKGTNLLQLQEAILVESEMLELKAELKGLVEGVVIESKTDPGRGKLSTALIQRGTLKKGAFLVAGTAYAKVRGMFDDQGRKIEKAEPGMAVEIMGWRELPSAGDEILQLKTESRMKEVINYRLEEQKLKKSELDQAVIEQKVAEHNAAYQEHLKIKQEQGGQHSRRFALLNRSPETPDEKTKLSIIIKGDVDGSVEAILDTLSTYESEICELDIVHFGVGMVTENDLELAESFNGVIYAFNVECPKAIAEKASAKKIPVKKHNIIYRLMEDLVEELTNVLPPAEVEDVVGEADVLQAFTIDVGKMKMPVAGCHCKSGTLSRKKRFKLMRHGNVIYDGPVTSMRHVKSEVETIRMGVDCGIMFDSTDLFIQTGDEVVCYEMIQVEQSIDWQPQF